MHPNIPICVECSSWQALFWQFLFWHIGSETRLGVSDKDSNKNKLSATVSSANWKFGDRNYYRQFAELSQKNQNLLQVIGLLKSVWPHSY